MAGKISVGIALLAALATGCSRAPRAQSKEAVEQAVREYLNTRQNLAVDMMDIEIERVEFSGKTAEADVTFRAKGSQGPGMNMHYTLSRRGDGWVVNQRPPGTMNPHGTQIPDQLPPGHPPVEGSSPPSGRPAPGGPGWKWPSERVPNPSRQPPPTP